MNYLGLFFESAEESKIIYNQVPKNTLLHDMEKLKNGFLTISFISLGDEGEIETDTFCFR